MRVGDVRFTIFCNLLVFINSDRLSPGVPEQIYANMRFADLRAAQRHHQRHTEHIADDELADADRNGTRDEAFPLQGEIAESKRAVIRKASHFKPTMRALKMTGGSGAEPGSPSSECCVQGKKMPASSVASVPNTVYDAERTARFEMRQPTASPRDGGRRKGREHR